MAVDAAGYVYVADYGNHRIRRIAPDGTISTYAGTGTAGYSGDGGPATEARINWSTGVAVDAAGFVYIADEGNNRIRRIGPNGIIDTIAGTGIAGHEGDGGPAVEAQLDFPVGIAVDSAGNVYVADGNNHRIRRIRPDGIIETIAGMGEAGYGGDGGAAAQARLHLPRGVAVDAAGNVYIADHYNNRIRVLEPPSDDHGDEVACATTLGLGVPVPGRIEQGDDEDWFRLDLSEAASVALYTTGDLDTVGSLRDETDAQLASNDDGGTGRNFHIEGDQPAGVYYIRVESYGGGTGSYTLHARRFADVQLGEIGEAVRLWAVSEGAWTLDRDTDAPFASGSEVVAPNGDRYVLTLDSDGVWRAAPVSQAVGSCEADLAATIRTLAGTGSQTTDGVTRSRLDYPTSLAVDAAGYVYAADSLDHQILRIAPDGTVETLAGTGEQGFDGDGDAATDAQLDNPSGLAVDAAGNVYFADGGNNRVRRIDPEGVIETIAGDGVEEFGGDGGPAIDAQLAPTDVAVDAAGNVYIADAGNHRVRRIGTDGIIETVAGNGGADFGGDGGPATEAALNTPIDVAVDAAGNLYIADYDNHRIRRVGPDGVITTIAGTGVAGFGGDGGPATAARLHYPIGVAVDAAGNVYVADRANHKVRRIGPDGIIQTVAGSGVEGFGGDGGPAVDALLDSPLDVAVDAARALYIADYANSRIRVVDPPADDHGDAAACATPLVLGVPMPSRFERGDDADWFRLVLNEPASLAVYSTGDLDTVGGLRSESGTQLVNDNDSGAGANFHVERDLEAGVYYIRVYSFENTAGEYTLHARLFADVALSQTGSDAIRVWRTATGGWTLDPGTGEPFASGGEALASNGARYTLTLGLNGVWTASPVAELCVASLAGTIRTLGGMAGLAGYAGDGGFAVDARLDNPFDVAVDAAGYVFVADRYNHRIRMIGPDGIIATFAGTGDAGFGGDGGPSTEADLNRPVGVAVDAAGYVYVADRLNHRIRRITTDGTIETIAGTGTDGYSGDGGPATEAQFDEPTGVAVDTAGNVYVADSQNHTVRRIGLGGTIETIAGTGSFGYTGDGGPATQARLTFPLDVAADASGSVYVADTFNQRIRRIGTDGTIETIAGTGTEGYGGDGGPAIEALFDNPSGVAVSAAGYIFVADWGNHRIRRIAPDGTIVTFAGTGVGGYGGDGGAAVQAQLLASSGVTVDAMGRVYIADASSHRVRVVDLAEGCR